MLKRLIIVVLLTTQMISHAAPRAKDEACEKKLTRFGLKTLMVTVTAATVATGLVAQFHRGITRAILEQDAWRHGEIPFRELADSDVTLRVLAEYWVDMHASTAVRANTLWGVARLVERDPEMRAASEALKIDWSQAEKYFPEGLVKPGSEFAADLEVLYYQILKEQFEEAVKSKSDASADDVMRALDREGLLKAAEISKSMDEEVNLHGMALDDANSEFLQMVSAVVAERLRSDPSLKVTYFKGAARQKAATYLDFPVPDRKEIPSIWPTQPGDESTYRKDLAVDILNKVQAEFLRTGKWLTPNEAFDSIIEDGKKL